MRLKLLLLLFVSLPLFGMRAPERLGKVAIANMHDGFKVLKDGKLNHITSDCLDSSLRKMDFKQRNLYIIKGGCLELNQANTGEYTLKSVANIKGGGPILGWIAWAAVMAPGLAIIALVKKMDKSGTAPTGQMYDCLNNVANVAKSFGDTAPTPVTKI